MPKKPNKKMIGIFTIISIITFITILIMFSSIKTFKLKDDQLVMFFNESINGLNIGSPVSFRGVEIGQVSKIELIPNKDKKGFSIPVFVKLNENQNFRARSSVWSGNNTVFLEDLVRNGLKAKLMTQSYLTGQLMIELEMLPKIQPVFQNKYIFKNVLEIPTVLSPIGELSQGIQNLPIKDIIEKFDKFLVNINEKFPIALDEIITMASNVNKAAITINNLAGSIDNSIENNTNTLPIIINNFNQTMIEIGEAANSLKNLTDFLERHPEAILKGKRK